MTNLKKLCKEFDINVRGIIQIGAHRGQEVGQFLELDPERILLIEAFPELALHLVDIFPRMRHLIKIANCAITNYNGKVKFNVLSNDMSSSILPLKKHAEIYPHIVKTGEIEIPCMRLDSLLKKMGEKFCNYNLLSIDVQGAEGLVFEGAMEVLKHIEVIQVEVNYDELYEGCILEPELTKLLRNNGFEKKAEQMYHPLWGDAFYVRSK